ncbi:PstS family phosphate ABC transporter substrate-binding protein [Amphibacillus cookii]|uniref:PstS family phosphate ABC transporter substrate-binding protein n=1 Tax=Amphibacillus cookii TaxID=767787 RepID=UPI00195D7490|nr:PstS family phosphate ABC transporter substrate-binding protein [Amphibacillus cookii]MBM7541733.1 phosphate transport system substrate-binding protein [Amphibacillus cookii]
MKKMKLVGLGLFMILMIGFLAACGGDDANTDADPADSNDETEDNQASDEALSGSVVIDGSGTVYPLMARVAEEYMTVAQHDVSVEVARAGTSAGFARFLVPDGTDFNDASRQIKEEELQAAEEAGFEVKELKVALDGLTFVVHPDNDWATELTEEDVVNIFRADGGITQWSDINSDWPAEEINTYGPNENHGTYEFFYEKILDEADLVDGVDLQQEYSTLVTLISEDENAIGFFGFGYYVNNQDQLGVVSVDFGDGPVEPTLETIDESGDYAPFTRPVFTYLNLDMAASKPQVLDYAIYLMDNVNTFAGETGFAPLPEEEVQADVEFLEGLK